MRTPLLIVDDLGVEPREIMDYGNVFTPLVDLTMSSSTPFSPLISPLPSLKRSMANASLTVSMKW